MQNCLNTKNDGKNVAEGAFTLVEVLTAAAIVAIVFTAVFAGVSGTFSLLNTTRENLRATQIIVSRLEGVRLEAWTSGQLFNTNFVPPTFVDYFYPPGLQSSNNMGTYYAGSMTITTNPVMSPASSYSSNMALVTVSVTWTNGPANGVVVHTRSMSTYVAQYGLQNYVYASH